ncbi:hypothetical protein AJ78_02075 [Emergomyces pasteurianus Ep9510]|uniref:Uncharacterized protein n=1 Tax=Emergomyces pasteurianus Ep9510 TaxID=1447872 RepID=A0A1J9PPL1_9EURO|nr:hypothetical protein AJ78_02075 [Emergomyces pasteurianus Ep9510]
MPAGPTVGSGSAAPPRSTASAALGGKRPRSTTASANDRGRRIRPSYELSLRRINRQFFEETPAATDNGNCSILTLLSRDKQQAEQAVLKDEWKDENEWNP